LPYDHLENEGKGEDKIIMAQMMHALVYALALAVT
jgi:hypothetical protein